MSDTAKRTALIVVVVLVSAVAIWQATAFFKGPTLEARGAPIGHFSAGHTGKGAMLETTGEKVQGK
jgi:hypothetical protein